jgi:ComF family protein
VAAIAAYKSPLSDALITFKYRPDRTFAEILASWLRHELIRRVWEPDVIVPVPLNKVRLRQRGYNQVELITSALARSTNLPQNSSMLQRVRDTRSQVGLNPMARFDNLENAFKAEAGSVQGRKVLLIDDLLTTGATIFFCSEALAEAGASRVYALAIARAV